MKIRCRDCHVEKVEFDFYVAKHTATGYTANCKECRKALARENYQQTREERLEKAVVRADTMRAELAAKARMYALRRFDLTPDEYVEMFESQDGNCALCDKPESVSHGEKLRRLSVDHDHTTNVVRGLLCTSCNTKLGWAEIIGLARIEEYIKRGSIG